MDGVAKQELEREDQACVAGVRNLLAGMAASSNNPPHATSQIGAGSASGRGTRGVCARSSRVTSIPTTVTE